MPLYYYNYPFFIVYGSCLITYRGVRYSVKHSWRHFDYCNCHELDNCTVMRLNHHAEYSVLTTLEPVPLKMGLC